MPAISGSNTRMRYCERLRRYPSVMPLVDEMTNATASSVRVTRRSGRNSPLLRMSTNWW